MRLRFARLWVAGQGEIRGLIFAEGFRLIAGGVVSGIVAAILLSRVLRSLLFGVVSTDAATLVAVGVLFAAVANLACWGSGGGGRAGSRSD